MNMTHPSSSSFLLLFILTLSSSFILIHAQDEFIPGVVNQEYNGLVQFGLVVADHNQTVPNYDSTRTIHYHYTMNNVPVNASAIIRSFQFLYTPNSAAPAGTIPTITIHVSRPLDNNPTALSRTLQYIRSYDLVNIQSNVDFQTTDPIYVDVNDIVTVSVPNDSLFLRVGLNKQGYKIAYGQIATIVGSSDVDRVGTFNVIEPNHVAGEEELQLCMQYLASLSKSYGLATGTTDASGSYNIYYFLMSQITETGVISSFSAQLSSTAGSSVELVVGRRTTVDTTTTLSIVSKYAVASYSSLGVFTIPEASRPSVLPGDLVGFATKTGQKLRFKSLSGTNKGYSLSTSVGVNVSQPYSNLPVFNYLPKIIVTVKYQALTDIPGCSLGYWKNCDAAWEESGFKTTDPISSMFTTTNWAIVGNGQLGLTTLLTALGMGGGGLNVVFRQGVAAYLDVATYRSSVTGYTVTQVMAEFKKQAESANPDGNIILANMAEFCHGAVLPTTAAPTTLAPTTKAPTTAAPTTLAPTTKAPTTSAPTTKAPTSTSTPTPTSATGGSGVRGDPVFSGFQGQSFQFHGLADEFFNLISSPTLQLNSHFVFLSSGRCDYADTQCFSHPGTYLDELGFSIPSHIGIVQIRVMAGSHAHGLRVFMGRDIGNGTVAEETEIKPTAGHATKMAWAMNNQTSSPKASVHFFEHRSVTIETPTFRIKVVNSDYFFNLEIAVLDHHLLKLGAAHHKIIDRHICDHHLHKHQQRDHGDHENEQEDETTHASHDHGLVERALFAAYGVDVQLHGLIGQTWRNVQVCGSHWVGVVNDYVVSDLFGSNYFYNFFAPDDENEKHSY